MTKVRVSKPKQVKIEPKTIDCIIIGYTNNSSAYCFLVHKSDIPDIHEDTIIEFRNASFFENIFPCKEKQEISSNKRTYDTANGNHQNEEEPKCNKRAKNRKSFGPDYLTYILDNEPKTFKEAMLTLEAPFWKEAINNEIESIMHNHTWKLVDLQLGNKPLGCK